MNQIKRFKIFVEELTDRQKAGFSSYADWHHNIKIPRFGPSKEALRLSQHVMPEGTDSIKIPVMNPTMQEIHDHLSNNFEGFSGMDYGNQKVFKDTKLNDGSTKRTEVKIGKALSQTGASKSLIGRFANDNHKESAELSSKYSIIFSRDPHHIAECSTDKPWSSCAKLDDEGDPADSDKELAAAHLPHDIQYGTHVAYLVPNMNHPDNQDKFHYLSKNSSHQELIDHAQARILVKPHQGSHGYTKDILVPESKAYSNMDKTPSGFFDSVKHFTDKHFTPEDNEIYHKHTDLYDDDGNSSHIHLNLNKPMKSNFIISDNLYKKQTHIKSDDISKFIDDAKDNRDHPNYDMMLELPKLPNFSSEHVDHYADNWDKFPDYTKGQIAQKKLTKSQHATIIEKVKNNPSHNEYYNNQIMMGLNNSPHTTSSHIKDLLTATVNHLPSYAHSELLSSDKLKGKDLTSVLDLYKGKLAENSFSKIRFNPNLEQSHVDTILSQPTYNSGFMGIPAIRHFDDIDGILDNLHNGKYHPDNASLVYNSVVEHPKFTTTHFNTMMNKPEFQKLYPHIQDSIVESYVGNHQKPEDIHNLIDNTLQHNFVGILNSRISSDKFNEEHVSKLIKPELIDHLANHSPFNNILNRLSFNKEHLDTLINPETLNKLNYGTFDKLLNNPNLTDDHLNRLATGFSKIRAEKQGQLTRNPKFNSYVDNNNIKFPTSAFNHF